MVVLKNDEVTKVNLGLEGTSDIMVTPKLGVASILQFNFIIQRLQYSERGSTRSEYCGFYIIINKVEQ